MLERKRNLLHLIAQYLNDFGLINTANTLLKECPILANKDHQVCDNIDLDSIYLDYMSYYHIKFGKYPKITRKLTENANGVPLDVIKKVANQMRRKSIPTDVNYTKEINGKESSLDSSLNATLLVSQCGSGGGEVLRKTDSTDGSSHLLKPLRNCSLYTPEWKEMAEIICR